MNVQDVKKLSNGAENRDLKADSKSQKKNKEDYQESSKNPFIQPRSNSSPHPTPERNIFLSNRSQVSSHPPYSNNFAHSKSTDTATVSLDFGSSSLPSSISNVPQVLTANNYGACTSMFPVHNPLTTSNYEFAANQQLTTNGYCGTVPSTILFTGALTPVPCTMAIAYETIPAPLANQLSPNPVPINEFACSGNNHNISVDMDLQTMPYPESFHMFPQQPKTQQEIYMRINSWGSHDPRSSVDRDSKNLSSCNPCRNSIRRVILFQNSREDSIQDEPAANVYPCKACEDSVKSDYTSTKDPKKYSSSRDKVESITSMDFKNNPILSEKENLEANPEETRSHRIISEKTGSGYGIQSLKIPKKKRLESLPPSLIVESKWENWDADDHQPQIGPETIESADESVEEMGTKKTMNIRVEDINGKRKTGGNVLDTRSSSSLSKDDPENSDKIRYKRSKSRIFEFDSTSDEIALAERLRKMKAKKRNASMMEDTVKVVEQKKPGWRNLKQLYSDQREFRFYQDITTEKKMRGCRFKKDGQIINYSMNKDSILEENQATDMTRIWKRRTKQKQPKKSLESSKEQVTQEHDALAGKKNDDQEDNMEVNSSANHMTMEEIASENKKQKDSEIILKKLLKYRVKETCCKYICFYCEFIGKEIVSHYAVSHPGEEVVISRLSMQNAQIAIDESKTLNSHEKLDSNVTSQFSCRFCPFNIRNLKNHDIECTAKKFFIHCSGHTGEFLFGCTECSHRYADMNVVSFHCLSKHKNLIKAGKIPMDTIREKKLPDDFFATGKVYGYICSVCNFVQLQKKNVEEHMRKWHSCSDGGKLVKINMSLSSEVAFASVKRKVERKDKSMKKKRAEASPNGILEVDEDENLEKSRSALENQLRQEYREIGKGERDEEAKNSIITEDNESTTNREDSSMDASNVESSSKISITSMIQRLTEKVALKRMENVWVEQNQVTQEKIRKEEEISKVRNRVRGNFFSDHSEKVMEKKIELVMLDDDDDEDDVEFLCEKKNSPYDPERTLSTVEESEESLIMCCGRVRVEPESSEATDMNFVGCSTDLMEFAVRNENFDFGNEMANKMKDTETPDSPVKRTSALDINSATVQKVPQECSNFSSTLEGLALRVADSSLPSYDIMQFSTNSTFPEIEMPITVFKSDETYVKMLNPEKLMHLYKCMGRECSFTNKEKEKMKVHYGIHESEEGSKPMYDFYNCPYCVVPFNNAEQLMVHFDEKHSFCNFQCCFCFYRAVSKVHVEVHQSLVHPEMDKRVLEVKSSGSMPEPRITLHSQVLPYTCKIDCDKHFYLAETFVSHLLRKHAEIKVYGCHMCEETFQTTTNLIAHYSIHGIDKYQCVHCIFGAATLSEIYVHLSIKHYYQVPIILERTLPPKPIQSISAFKQLVTRNLEDQSSEMKISAHVSGAYDKVAKKLSFAMKDFNGSEESRKIFYINPYENFVPFQEPLTSKRLMPDLMGIKNFKLKLLVSEVRNKERRKIYQLIPE